MNAKVGKKSATTSTAVTTRSKSRTADEKRSSVEGLSTSKGSLSRTSLSSSSTTLKKKTDTVETRLAKIELLLKSTVERLNAFETDLILIKQQVIEHTRDANSMLLDASVVASRDISKDDSTNKNGFPAMLRRLSVLESAFAELKGETEQVMCNVVTPVNNTVEPANLVADTDAVLPTRNSPPHVTINGTPLSTPAPETSITLPLAAEPTIPTMNSTTNHEQSPQRQLSPKWKWFHLSSLVALTPDIVKQYVSFKLNNGAVRCYSLTPQNSKTFKVGVPFEFGKRLFDKSFWPIGTQVRDFQVRKNFRMRPVESRVI